MSGVIGWDIYAADVRRQLAEAGSEDIEVQIASPGGFVYDGLEIYNLLRRHPGAVTTRLMGLAASMASYIAMAGSRVIAEDNVVFMIHNPWNMAVGDYREMRKNADYLGGLAGITAKAYAAKTGKPLEDVRALMDEETWLFGEEALDAGFVDEIVPASAPEEAEPDKEAAVAQARVRVEEAKKLIREVSTAEDASKAAALIQTIEAKSTGVAGSKQPAAKADQHTKEVQMNLDALKTEHPAVFAEAVQAGVKQERDRVSALAKWKKNGPAAVEIVERAIASGESVNDVLPELMAAAREAATENPPEVPTGVAKTGSGEGADPKAEVEDVLARMRKLG